VDGSKIIFMDTVLQKDPINDTLAMNVTGTMNEIGPLSAMVLNKITNETRPMNSIFLDKITNETKPMHINTTINETIHQHVQNSTSKADVNYFIPNFILEMLLVIF